MAWPCWRSTASSDRIPKPRTPSRHSRSNGFQLGSPLAPSPSPDVSPQPLRVTVESLAGLLPQPAGEDHALEQRRGGVPRLAKLLEQDGGDVVRRVEADEVEQRERPHRVAASEFHPLVDVVERAQAVLVRANGIEQIRHQQPIDDESGTVR